MKLFALKDSFDPDASVLAILCCYERERVYYIDMPSGTDPWTVPFILSSFAAREEWTVGADWSQKWVESRIVPQSRQNLGEVLRENGLDCYDTLRLLELTEGKNSQDSCYLEPIELADSPAWFREREANRVLEAIPLEGNRLFVAFRTGEVRLCDMAAFAELRSTADSGLARVASDPALFERCEVAPGGRGVRWGAAIGIDDRRLLAAGEPTGLAWGDLVRILSALLLTTNEASQMLGCTRQNLNALVKRGGLSPVKASEKATLFLRPDICARIPDMLEDGNAVRYAHVRLRE
jgi:hypothetical protein